MERYQPLSISWGRVCTILDEQGEDEIVARLSRRKIADLAPRLPAVALRNGRWVAQVGAEAEIADAIAALMGRPRSTAVSNAA